MTYRNQEHFQRAQRVIPWGTQTNAKRYGHDGMEARPAFIERAKGCRMWDLDGRSYLDYRAALGPILLGYGEEHVDAAVRTQMEKGVLFSMASPLEAETAEAILDTIQWADQIRFMKTGVDACSCCLRLARSHTGRDHLLTCGYHGYQDWFALDWPEPGIPAALHPFVHEVSYGDIAAVDRVFDEFGEQLAAALVVPIEWMLNPDQAFLERLRMRSDEYETALIFDEVLTGFRLAPGGARELFGVEPDMAAYAKAMANGYPLSAYAGKREWMQTLEQTIITTTYAGETLSLAAAKAVMQIIAEEPVHAHLFQQGKMLRDGFRQIFQQTGFPATTIGVDCGFEIDFSPAGTAAETMKTALFNALYAQGIFANNQWFITYAHQSEDIAETLEAMESSIKAIL